MKILAIARDFRGNGNRNPEQVDIETEISVRSQPGAHAGVAMEAALFLLSREFSL